MVRPTTWRPLRNLGLALAVAVAMAGLATPAGAAADATQLESCLLSAINSSRAAAGVLPVEQAVDLTNAVRDHSAAMSATELRHMTDAEREAILPEDASAWAENVGWTSVIELDSCDRIHDSFLGSTSHRDNLLDPDMEHVALGVAVSPAGVWTTEMFFQSDSYVASWEGTFSDDDGTAFEEDIEKLAGAGVTVGCDDDRFCPTDPVTRGQMAAFLARSLGLPVAEPAGFVDTADSAFAADIDAIAAAGITRGCGSNRFCPDESITRGQMAAFLVRALDLPPASSAGFEDTAVSLFVRDIDTLAAAEITRGCAADLYCPDEAVTRGQMAAFLVRALGL